MTKIVLLGIIGLSMFAVAPFVGASNNISSSETRNPLSTLFARTVFDFAEEVEGRDGEERRENRSERREEGAFEERHEDAERFFD
ncbi:MAG: hypothetical protein AB4050_08150 [Synechococcus sp.]